MSRFTLAISCLTTSNLPWFMDLTFQVPMQYCPLLHRTLLLLPVTSTTGYCFCFDSISSFFQELFLHWSPVAYWAPLTWEVHLSVSCLFAFSYCSWGSQGKNTEVVCHSLHQWTPFCQEKKCKKAKWLFREALQIAVKTRESKSKGEKERYKHVNAEFQRIARRDKKSLPQPSMQRNRGKQ